jgi:protein-S-isoprenylcysteine O-methyltransferase Ste14
VLLVGPHEPGLADEVAVHRRLDLRFGRLAQVAEVGVARNGISPVLRYSVTLALMASLRDLSRLSLPPPVYFAAGLAIGILLHLAFPIPLYNPYVTLAFGFLLLLGAGAVGGMAMQAFRRKNMSLVRALPSQPLLVDGPYRWSRNPMYLSLGLAYAGIAFLVNAVGVLLVLPVVLFVVEKRVILREEGYLERRFGAAYRQYKATVPRWVTWPSRRKA